MKKGDPVSHVDYPGEVLTFETVIRGMAKCTLPKHLQTPLFPNRNNEICICDVKYLTPIVEKPKEVKSPKQFKIDL